VLTDGTVSKLKKAMLISFTILFLLSILFLKDYRMFVKAGSVTWTVDDDGPADFSTVQEAINIAAPGDTIFVHIGTYYENILVDKTVSLIGENKDETIVYGNGTGSVISLKANDINIQGFTIKNSSDRLYDSGIFIDRRSSGNSISLNTISNNNDGITLYSSSDNIVSNNTISNNTSNGIVLYSSNNNIFSGNTISNNSDGISLYSSSNNMFSRNTISNNKNGIYPAFDSINSTIYHNNFNNGKNVQTDSINSWDYEGEGNYWSDYAGNDPNGDGIGKIPYIIDSYNQDEYPLMGMFSEFSITLETEAYIVTTICNSTVSNLIFEIGVETGNKLIHFNIAGEDRTAGFCRVAIPTGLMKPPYIVLVGSNEVNATLLNGSNETYKRLYFTYSHKSRTVSIISSETQLLYNELLTNYRQLQEDLSDLNTTHQGLLNNYNILLDNYSQLQESIDELNASYEKHLSDYSGQMQIIRSLVYMFAATTGIFMITTIYLSKIAHTSIRTKTKESITK